MKTYLFVNQYGEKEEKRKKILVSIGKCARVIKEIFNVSHLAM